MRLSISIIYILADFTMGREMKALDLNNAMKSRNEFKAIKNKKQIRKYLDKLLKTNPELPGTDEIYTERCYHKIKDFNLP